MMKTPILPLMLLALTTAGTVRAEKVYILHESTVPSAAYAARRLGEALPVRGHEILSERSGHDRLISLAVHPGRLGREAFAIIPEGRLITVYGGGLRGMIYGALALVETVRQGTALGDVAPDEQRGHTWSFAVSNTTCRGKPTAPAPRSTSTTRRHAT